MPFNSNFRYSEQISESPEYELRKSFILSYLVRTPIIQVFANLNIFSVHKVKYASQFELSANYDQKVGENKIKKINL